MQRDNQNKKYLPARQVWERYGVTSMSLHRWVQNPEMGFPQPIYIGRNRYWDESELTAWERRRATEAA
jgi:predicted DNA-binding transcriptional regulator AlpA